MVLWGFPGGTSGKESACECKRHKEVWVRSLGWEDPLEVGMATHYSVLAWRIPWMDEIKKHLLLGRKVITNLDSILKSRDIALPTKVHLVKAMFFSSDHVRM